MTTEATYPIPADFLAEHACKVVGCGRVFPSQQALSGHMMSHRVPVPCPECGKEYKTEGALGNHRKNDHGIEPPRKAKAAKTKKPSAYGYNEVFELMVGALWPGGSVPVDCILPLVEWREQTREFLEKVNGD